MGPKRKSNDQLKKRNRSGSVSSESEESGGDLPIASDLRKTPPPKPTSKAPKVTKVRMAARQGVVEHMTEQQTAARVVAPSSPMPRRYPPSELPSWSSVVMKESFVSLGSVLVQKITALGLNWVLKCELCSTPTKPHILLTANYSNWMRHGLRHAPTPQSLDTPRASQASTSLTVPSAPFCDLVIKWGLSFVQGAGILNDLFPGSTSRKKLHREVVAELAARDEWLKNHLTCVQNLSLSIDGGTSVAKKNHLLVVTLHHQQAQWVLRPQWSADGKAWNGESAARSIVDVLGVYGVKLAAVRHIMVDGARYNEVCIDALSFAREVGRISLVCDEEGSDMDDPDEEREYVADQGFFNGIQTAFNTSLTGIRPLLCHGHVAMIRIYKSLTSFGWKNYVAAELTSLLSTMLYSKGAGTRKGRLIQFLADKKKENAYRALNGDQKVIAKIDTILCGHSWLNATTAPQARLHLLEALKPFPLIVLKMATGFTSVASFVEECQLLRTAMTNEIAALQELQIPLAVCNATRWHTSVFRSYEFMNKHIDDVTEWIRTEANHNASMKRWLTLVPNITQAKLHIAMYVRVFSPVATFLTWISDCSRCVPYATQLFDRYSAINDSYVTMARASQDADEGRLISCVCEAMKHTPEHLDMKMWEAIALLDPVRSSVLGISLSAHEFSKAVNLEINKEEWEAYAASTVLPPTVSVPDYWASKGDEWPTLAKVAVYLIWLPVVVTSCDSVLSVEKHVLGSRRSRLDEEVASGLVSWKCNGKPNTLNS